MRMKKELAVDPAGDGLFGSDLWAAALEKYASTTHLTVRLFDADGRAVFRESPPDAVVSIVR